MSSSSVPLITDQDVELGEPPSYEHVAKSGFLTANNFKTTKFHGLFTKNGESSDSASVAFANVAIRLGNCFN